VNSRYYTHSVTVHVASLIIIVDDRKLNSKHVSVCDCLSSWKPRLGIKISEGANCLALCPSSGQFHSTYLAIGFYNGNVHIYNSSHKLTCKLKASQQKSSILTVAHSLQVGLHVWCQLLQVMQLLLQDPLVCAGSRNGGCFVWDIRLGSSPTMCVKEPLVGTRLSSSVIGLHPLQDHNYIICSALNSRVSEVAILDLIIVLYTTQNPVQFFSVEHPSFIQQANAL
jgi:hypothetical protein